MALCIVKVGELTYDQEQIIGRGARGTFVFSGFHKGKSIGFRKAVAVKRPQRIRRDCDVQHEVAIIQKASGHPNILRYICTETDEFFKYFATELCRGTLMHYIHGTYQGPEFTSDIEILSQVTQGLAYLHGLKIVHGSMKPSHILIFVPEGRNDGPLIKLAGFGRSKVLIYDASVEDLAKSLHAPANNTVEYVTNGPNEMELILSRDWLAPEIEKLNSCDFRGDIWALGCIFAYTLCGGKHPFGEDPIDRAVFIKEKKPMLMVQENLKRPYSKDGEAFQLIKIMLEMEPEIRPTAEVAQKSISQLLEKYDFNTIKDRARKFLDVCRTFSESNDEKFSKFKELVEDESVDMNSMVGVGETPLAWFCKHYRSDNLVDIVKILIENGAEVIGEYEYGVTPLHTLCVNYKHENLIELIQLFKQSGAEVDAWTKSRETPLRLICENYKHRNLMDVVKFLIDNGADIKLKAKDGFSPADILINKGFIV